MSDSKTKTVKLPTKGYMPRQKDLGEEPDMPEPSVDEANEIFFTQLSLRRTSNQARATT